MVGNNLAVDVLTPHPKIKMEWLFDSERSDRHRQHITDESEPPRKAGQQYCPDNAVTKNRKTQSARLAGAIEPRGSLGARSDHQQGAGKRSRRPVPACVGVADGPQAPEARLRLRPLGQGRGTPYPPSHGDRSRHPTCTGSVKRFSVQAMDGCRSCNGGSSYRGCSRGLLAGASAAVTSGRGFQGPRLPIFTSPIVRLCLSAREIGCMILEIRRI